MTTAEIAAKMITSDSDLWEQLVSDVEMKTFHLGALTGKRKMFEKASREAFVLRSEDTIITVKRGVGKVTWHRGRSFGPGVQHQFSEGFYEIVSGVYVKDGRPFASTEEAAAQLIELLI